MSPSERPLTNAPLVLGVDPDAVTRGLLALYLEPLGLTVRLVGVVSDALEQLERERPRAFICAESALEKAEPHHREQLRARLGAVSIVVLLEPGEAPVWSRGWSNVLERLTKPLRGELLVTLAGRWSQSPASQGGQGAADGIDCLAGLDALVQELGMEPELVRDLVRSFLARAPQYLGELRAALAAQDSEGMRRTLHAITGMCANLRLESLVALTDTVRRAVVAGDLVAAGAACGRLEERCTQVVAAAGARWNITQ